MTSENRQVIISLAKGSWQRMIARDLADYGEITNPVKALQGSAKRYSLNYQRSFQSLISRIRQAGFEVSHQPGPRGGEWSAVYSIR